MTNRRDERRIDEALKVWSRRHQPVNADRRKHLLHRIRARQGALRRRAVWTTAGAVLAASVVVAALIETTWRSATRPRMREVAEPMVAEPSPRTLAERSSSPKPSSDDRGRPKFRIAKSPEVRPRQPGRQPKKTRTPADLTPRATKAKKQTRGRVAFVASEKKTKPVRRHPAATGAVKPHFDPAEAMARADRLRRQAKWRRAVEVYRRVAEHPHAGPFREEAYLRRAALLGRLGRAADGIAVLLQADARITQPLLRPERRALMKQLMITQGKRTDHVDPQ